MKRKTLLRYRKTNHNIMKAKAATMINPTYCPICSGRRVELTGGNHDGRLDDGRNSFGFFCGTCGQLPPKFGTPHPPTCSSAARIPTNAKRDHCPQLKRVKSCCRVCCKAGWKQSTAEIGNGASRLKTTRYHEERASGYGPTSNDRRAVCGLTRIAALLRDRDLRLAKPESPR